MKQIERLTQQGLDYFHNQPILLLLLIVFTVALIFSSGWLIAARKTRNLESRRAMIEVELNNNKEVLRGVQQTLELKTSELQNSLQEYAGLQATLEAKQESFSQQKQILEDAEKRLNSQFENLANKIFTAKQKDFSKQSNQSIDAVLKPFQSQLESFRKRVDEVHTERTREQASLKTQLENLHDLNQQITAEASQLTQALKGDKKMQGDWGEIQVEMILDRSGLIKGAEYEREANFKDDDKQNLRPDFIIKLPENKHLIIDSKVSLVDFNRYVAATDEDERKAALKSHVQAVENHIKNLSSKSYPSIKGMNSPDMVLMFMPIEPAFLTAFQHKPELYNSAFEKRIVVVTTSTLLATLKTVSGIWSIERQNKSARQLAELAGRVYDKLRIVTEKVGKLEQQLGTAQKTCDEVQRSLSGHGSLTTTIGKFQALGVRVKKELPAEILDQAGVLDVGDERIVEALDAPKDDKLD